MCWGAQALSRCHCSRSYQPTKLRFNVTHLGETGHCHQLDNEPQRNLISLVGGVTFDLGGPTDASVALTPGGPTDCGIWRQAASRLLQGTVKPLPSSISFSILPNISDSWLMYRTGTFSNFWNSFLTNVRSQTSCIPKHTLCIGQKEGRLKTSILAYIFRHFLQ